MKRLAIITTHPIQYNAPLFRLLSKRKRISVKVFYTWGQSKETVFDARFGLQRSWDIPVLEGYEYEFVDNTSKQPDSNNFFGVINPGLIDKLKKEHFDAILVYRWSVWSHLRVLRSFGKAPKLLFRGDSHLFNFRNNLKGVIKKWLLQFVYRRVDYALYVGKHNKDYYQLSGLRNGQLVYAPHAIDNERFSKGGDEWEKKANEERALWSIPEHCIVFLYAGKFYEVKQLDLLIDVFKDLKGDGYRLVLVGSGEQEKQLRMEAVRDERIIFQPFRNQSEMPLVYRMGDVFVLPSKSETWGLSVNEAMACGRPAIVSDACGCATELIKKGETGFVFDHTNRNELLTALQQFTSNKIARAMGGHAFVHIQQFSLERVAEAIEKKVMG